MAVNRGTRRTRDAEPGVTITSGGVVPRIDLSGLFRRTDLNASAGGGQSEGAIPGGAGITAAGQTDGRTVALPDGTRITFGSAMVPETV